MGCSGNFYGALIKQGESDEVVNAVFNSDLTAALSSVAEAVIDNGRVRLPHLLSLHQIRP